jgi:hypothetical protein
MDYLVTEVIMKEWYGTQGIHMSWRKINEGGEKELEKPNKQMGEKNVKLW